MTEQAVPAADTGLPISSASLVESSGGLAIVRMRGRAPRPSMLSDEENELLLELLNEHVSACVQADIVRNRISAMSHDVFKEQITGANSAASAAKRKMHRLLKKVRTAKSKTIDDILFKAMICEAIDVYECRSSRTLGHSIVSDLLSAECAWRD